ncbi:hypothetical protein AB0F72_26535 [Actinoplanes sp. NPDC023936]|uniref:hypothetical protein n=1 Tax=Actinoplanes sp. NPDC023936 TaxID=3154910 RepID=UPI0033CE3E04
MSTVVSLVLMALALAVMFALLIAAATGWLAYVGGVAPAAAILRAGVAFGGTLTLLMGLVGIVVAVVQR